jgi:hypothetical protein
MAQACEKIDVRQHHRDYMDGRLQRWIYPGGPPIKTPTDIDVAQLFGIIH